MIVTSGSIPYDYEGTYPFEVPDNETVPFSGILFEQTMTVISAETFRYIGAELDEITFNKYIQEDVDPIIFTPRPDGSNLDGTIDGIPGNAAFVSYMDDMRSAFEFYLFITQFDLEGPVNTILTDWLLFVGSESGTHGNYTRQAYSSFGPVTSTDITDLEASGTRFDIDLREVSYQPYSRMGQRRHFDYKFANIGTGPYYPNFQTTAGGFVARNYIDNSLFFDDRQVAGLNSGIICFDGDMFFASTDFCLGPGTATRDNLEGVITHNALGIHSLPGRPFITNAIGAISDPRARALLFPPNLSFGGYFLGAINDPIALPKLVLPSGTLSFSPPIRYDGYPSVSGYYVFNNSFWILDSYQLHPSGVMLVNPHTASGIWFRHADQASFTDQAGFVEAFTNSAGLADNGSDLFRVHVTGDTTSLLNDIRIAFFQYSRTDFTLETVVNPSEDYSIFGPNDSSPSVAHDVCSDGAQFIILAQSQGVFRNLYFYDNAFGFTDQKLYLDTPLYWIQNTIFGGGTYGCTDLNVLSELIIDPSTSNPVVTQGTAYTVDTSGPGWPADAGGDIGLLWDAQAISGDPNIPAGTWLLAQTATKVVLFRATLSGTSIIPHEVYVLASLPPLGPDDLTNYNRYQFYFGPIS